MDEKRFFTSSGTEIKPYYTQEDLEAIGFNPDRDLGLPGEFPSPLCSDNRTVVMMNPDNLSGYFYSFA